MKERLLKLLPFLLLAVLLYMPVFSFLDRLPIRLWDESRLAVNAYEMYQGGDLIVTQYGGEPDMWNTKPPVMIWLQVLCMKLFGVNELSVRLPSALAAFFTAILLMGFAVRHLGRKWLGFAAVLVMITSPGYIGHHVSRTGDYDALLILFTTAGALLYFLYLESKKPWQLYLFFAALALGVLTKSITGLLFAPAMLLYALMQKEFAGLFRLKHFYIGLGAFLVLVLGYYLLRESRNPGYLQAVMANELGGRYLDTIEGHRHGFWFYYSKIIDERFSWWYLLVPGGFLAGLFSGVPKLVRLSRFLLLLVLTYFLIISVSKTKLIWYDAPMYPFLAIAVAIFIQFIFDFLKQVKYFQEKLVFNFVPYLFVFMIFVAPYRQIVKQTSPPSELPWEVEMYAPGKYLKEAVKGKHTLQDVSGYLSIGYNPHELFYHNILNDQGKGLQNLNGQTLEEGTTLLVWQHAVNDSLQGIYQLELLEEKYPIRKYKVVGSKSGL